MQRERYEQAARLFEEAMARTPEHREEFLVQAVNGDFELLHDVKRLIEYDERGEPTAGLWPGDPRLNPLSDNLAGKTAGKFLLTTLIGEGAFGAVYKAEQSAPVRRTVAVKVLKAGMDSQQILARFDAERQALAMMEHPGIARVIDAGQTDAIDGSRPYFVMEFVTGEPITVACERAGLDLEARLELFCLVCQAVQHAHHRGIIHRDIKPSNILVCDVDGIAVPKVIDFGIAKAIHQPLSDAMALTNRLELLGTPQYMSPEQADSNEHAIDTRTDVYSLGVVLYELLTGSPPLDEQSLHDASYSRMIELIREHQVVRPSTRLSQAAVVDRKSEAVMGRDRGAWARRLRGDLDWIALKALDSDRERRYQSPAAFAEDLRRHMRHEPVIAVPPSAAYRMRRFIRRHRLGVTASVLLSLTLIGGVIGTSIGLWQSTRSQKKAELEAAKSQQIALFSHQMLTGINPAIARGKDTQLLRMILEEAAARVDKDLADQPEVEAAIRTTIGCAYLALAQFDDARPQLERALTVRRTILGNDHPDTLASVSHVGRLLWLQSKYSEAESYWQEALDGRRDVLGTDHPDTLKSLNEMGNLRWDQGRLDEGTVCLRQVLERRRSILGNTHPETLMSIMNMGAILKDQGKLGESEPYHREALDGYRSFAGNDHPSTLAAISNMGRLKAAQGKFDEAEAFFAEGIQGYRKVMGNEHPQTLFTINSMAVLLNRQRKFVEAEQMYREVLEVRRRTLGDDHSNTLLSLNNVGSVLVDQGRYEEARVYFDEALERQKRTLGPNHPDTLRSLHNMGALIEKLGQFSEAESYFLQALDGRRRQFGAHSPVTASTANNLALMLLTAASQDARDPKRALELALEANVATDYGNPDYLDVLAMAYQQTGQIEDAIETQARAISLLPSDSPTRDQFEQRRKAYESLLTQGSKEGGPQPSNTQPTSAAIGSGG